MIQNLAGPKSHLEERVDIAAYLRRIGYTGPIVPTLETLREIHRAHLLAVPFENLDIPLGRQIACDEDIFVCKIVERRRADRGKQNTRLRSSRGTCGSSLGCVTTTRPRPSLRLPGSACVQ